MQEHKRATGLSTLSSFSCFVVFGMTLEEVKQEPKLPTSAQIPQQPTIWQVPQIQEAIPKIVEMLQWHFQDRSKSNLKITYIFVSLLGLLTLGIFVLTWFGKASGDTVIFLIGSLFGYIFAFLQKYLGPS